MYNSDTELLFPPRIIPALRNLRGARWQKLIDRIDESDEMSPEKVAFVLMMVRINGCASCNADSFRAMHGCTQCAKQAIRRIKETDKEIKETLESATQEVIQYLELKS